MRFYELINETTIKPSPRPLRIGDKDIFTTDEKIYNDNGYYRLEREDYPEDEEYSYSMYYELIGNVIYQKWRRGEKIEGDTNAD